MELFYLQLCLEAFLLIVGAFFCSQFLLFACSRKRPFGLIQLVLSVCRPARDPKAGKPPKVLPGVLSGDWRVF